MACEALAALPLDFATPADVAELFSTGALADGDVAFVETAALLGVADALRRAAAGMDGAGADGRRLAQQLSEAGVDPRAAVVVFYRVIGAAGRGASTDEQVQALAAASCYALLVRCVGEAFQPMVLRRALSALRVRSGGAGGAGGTKRKAAGSRAAPAKRSTAAEQDGADTPDVDDQQDEDEQEAAAAADPEAVARRRDAAIEDVATLVSPGPFSLSGYSDALVNLVEVMVDLIASVGLQSGQQPADAPPFHVLGGILGQQHGPPADTMKVVFHALLPVLLASASRSSGAAIPRAAIRCRDGAFGFISALMSDPAGACQAHPVHLVALCQHMCMKVSDRAEYRRSTCQTVVKLLLLLPAEQLSHFIRFLSKYSKNEKALFRHFSCDVSLEILTAMQEVTLDTTTAFSILKARATDKAPTVRAKALTQLSACLMGPRATDLLGNGTAVDSLLALARARSRDAKPAVRKAGLTLLCAVLRRCVAGAADDGTCGHPGAQMEAIDPADIQIIAERCRDSALTTRKAALQMLTDLLLAAPGSEAVQETWLKTVLPTVLDQQASAVDGCCSLAYAVLLAPLTSNDSAESPSELAWSLLERIRNPDSLQCLHKIIKLLHGMPKFATKIGSAHVTAAQRRLEMSGNSVGPWVLLEEISHVGAAGIDAELTWKTWETLQAKLPSLPNDDPDQIIAVHALCVFANCQLHGSRAASAGKAVVSVVRKLCHNPQVTKAALDCLGSMAKLSTNSDKAFGAKLLEWGAALMSDCDTVLYDYMFGADAEAETDQAVHQRVVISLFITGEISLVCAKAVPKRVVSVLQSLVNPADNAEAGFGVRTSVPENVRAHAIVALGKVCLDDQSLAIKCVAAFSRELLDKSKSDAPVIRNNIIFILSDLCRRFTSLVDPHLPLLSRCLGDPLPIVRKQTMLLLAGLLQEDYLKWKGPLFFRFLIMSIDTDVEIAAQARFILFTLFHKVDDKLLCNHFVEALFYLNDFAGHESYNQFSQNDSDRSLFCLPGKDMQDKRMRIYTAMLAPLPDDQKLHVRYAAYILVLTLVPSPVHLLPDAENTAHMLYPRVCFVDYCPTMPRRPCACN
jgi:condensin-2 complex subunit D3